MYKVEEKGATFVVYKDGKMVAHCTSEYACLKAVWKHNGSKEDEFYSFVDGEIVNVGRENNPSS